MEKTNLGATCATATLLRRRWRLTLALCVGLGAFACSSGDDDPQTACSPGSGCPAGQVCSDEGICKDGDTTPGELALLADGARACEILLESAATEVVRIAPRSGVEGVLRARPPRYAIAIASPAGALPSDAVSLELNGEPSGVSVSKVECFDEAGALLTSASASID
ncbi:MAG: hypothetical protein RMA76_09495 [Deltaproteobacteria bacterium]